MATLTVYSTAADGYTQSSNAAYATARAGGAFTVGTADEFVIAGQQSGGGVYNCYESGLDFDTSSLTALATISSALMTLTHNTNNTACVNTGKIFQARLHDWGVAWTSADWVAGDSLAAKTLLATHTSTGASSGAVTFTDVAMAANVSKTGVTRILLCGKDHVDNIAPTLDTNEQIYYQSADTVGTTSDPKMVVEYTLPSLASSFNRFQRRSRVAYSGRGR